MTLDILIFLLYTIRHAIDILPDALLIHVVYQPVVHFICLKHRVYKYAYRLLQLINVNEVDNMIYQPGRFDIH